MKDIADDLINDLEDLENSTEELNEQVDQVVKNNATLDKYTGETAMETAVLMLEASKVAQESAISSQETASVNLKLAGQQQQQIDSMHDAGISWRQTIRDANLEIKSSRGFFVGMLTSAIILTLIAAGLMSWLVLMSKNNQAESQSQLMDMIQTESSLNQRQVNMKIDELASVVENALSYQRNGASNTDSKSSKSSSDELAEGSIDANNQPADITNTSLNESQTSATAQFDEIQKSIAKSLNEYKASLKDLAMTNTSSMDGQKVDLEPLNNQLAKIENLLQAQSAQIDSINKSLERSVKQNVANEKPEPSVVKNTNNTLSSQLADIKKQLDSLQNRQSDIYTNLQKLTNEFAKAKEDAANEGPKPYSYRNPYEYKQ